ncbi:MAG TPA: ribonuclease P protein component [Cytophagaceae bacterium]
MRSSDEHKDKTDDYTFPKNEKLCSLKLIEELFRKGESHFLYPIKLLVLKRKEPLPSQPYPQVLFSVPKKNFKKAVDRNRIKRQLREAYRLNKNTFFKATHPEKNPLALAIIFVAREKIDFHTIEKKLILILERLQGI